MAAKKPALPGETLVTFRAGFLADDLAQRLDREGRGIGSAAKADLSRYYILLKIGRDGIAGKLSTNEMNLIVAGVVEERRPELLEFGYADYDAARAQKELLVARIRAAVSRHPLEQVHNVDAEALIRKIDLMNESQVAALVDTAERVWRLRPHATPASYADELDFFASDYVPRSFDQFVTLIDNAVVNGDPSLDSALNDKAAIDDAGRSTSRGEAAWSSPVGHVSVQAHENSVRAIGVPAAYEPVPAMPKTNETHQRFDAPQRHHFEYWLTGTTQRNANLIAQDIISYLNGRKPRAPR